MNSINNPLHNVSGLFSSGLSVLKIIRNVCSIANQRFSTPIPNQSTHSLAPPPPVAAAVQQTASESSAKRDSAVVNKKSHWFRPILSCFISRCYLRTVDSTAYQLSPPPPETTLKTGALPPIPSSAKGIATPADPKGAAVPITKDPPPDTKPQTEAHLPIPSSAEGSATPADLEGAAVLTTEDPLPDTEPQTKAHLPIPSSAKGIATPADPKSASVPITIERRISLGSHTYKIEISGPSSLSESDWESMLCAIEAMMKDREKAAPLPPSFSLIFDPEEKKTRMEYKEKDTTFVQDLPTTAHAQALLQYAKTKNIRELKAYRTAPPVDRLIEKEPIGLANPTKTACPMNALLQMAMSNPYIASFFMLPKGQNPSKIDTEKWMQDLGFDTTIQQDPCEILQKLNALPGECVATENLYQCVSPTNEKVDAKARQYNLQKLEIPNNYYIENDPIYSHIQPKQWITPIIHIATDKEGKIPATFESGIQPTPSIETTTPQFISDGVDNDSGERVFELIEQKMQFVTPPPFFAVRVDRHSSEGKDDREMPIDEMITLEKTTPTATRYFLQSFLVHKGSSTTSGHYVAYYVARKGNEVCYYKADDEKVSVITRSAFAAEAKRAYLAFYNEIS